MMTRRRQRKQFDINAQIMSGGVGLAALEAMFNLVNTQSTLSASMVRDHEMCGPIQMQALAGALAQILAVTDNVCCRGAVAVDIPPSRQKSADAGGDGREFGAVSGIDALNNLLNKTQGDTTNTTTTKDSGIDHVLVQSMINEQTHQLHDQFVDIMGSSAQKLAVT